MNDYLDDFSLSCYLPVDEKYMRFIGKDYQIDFELLKKYSTFFRESKDFQNEKYLSFVYPRFITEYSFNSFINACQNREFKIDKKNVFGLYYLSKRFEVPTLKQKVKEAIEKNINNLLIESLNYKIFSVQEMSQLNKEIFAKDTSLKLVEDSDDNFLDYNNEITIIGNSLNLYLEKENFKNFLLSLPIPVVYKIVQHYTIKNNEIFSQNSSSNQSNSVVDFILEFIEKNGKNSTVLLSFNQFKEIMPFILDKIKSKNIQIDKSYINNGLNINKNDFKRQNDDFLGNLKGKIGEHNENIKELNEMIMNHKYTLDLIDQCIYNWYSELKQKNANES